MIINNKVIKHICMMLILSSNAGFLHAASVDDMTPIRQRVGELSIAGAAFTPGRAVSQLQSQVLTIARFEEVFGVLPEPLESVDFEQFKNASEIFDKASRRTAVRAITAFVTKKFIENPTNQKLVLFYAEIQAISSAIAQVHPERLWERTEDYFRGRFPDSTVGRQHKQSGDQLGLTAVVKRGSEKPVKYFVKTHANGIKSGSGSAAADLVQPEELMSYALLEELGIGCEAHFFGRDARNFYVATKDAGHNFPFNVFQRLIESHSSGVKHDEKYAQNLWGNLGKLITDTPANNREAEYAALIEGEIQNNPIAGNFAHQIAMLDVVSRLMRLNDLLSNSENFGFIETTLGKMLTVIDFRYLGDGRIKMNYDHFGGFEEGNGLFMYHTAHATVAYILRQRNLELRVGSALRVMVEDLHDMPDAIERAYRKVHSLSSEMLHDDKASNNHGQFLEGLTSYKDALLHNYVFFKRSLEEWKPGSKE